MQMVPISTTNFQTFAEIAFTFTLTPVIVARVAGLRAADGLRRRLPARGARGAHEDRRRAARGMTPVRAPTLRALAAHAVARSLHASPTLADAIARARLRAARPDPRARARGRPDPAPPRRRLPRRRPRPRVSVRCRSPRTIVHVYGVLPLPRAALLHPRDARHRRGRARASAARARACSTHVARARRDASARPRAARCAHAGSSAAGAASPRRPTRMLEALHHRGELRVVRRANGVKVYASRRPAAPALARGRARARRSCTRCSICTRRCPSRVVAPAGAHGDGELAAADAARDARSTRCSHGPDVARVDDRRRRDWLQLAHEPMRDDVGDARARCWRRSIPSSGTAAGSRRSGDGTTGSRPIRRPRSASSATTRCRCCGVTTSWAGPTRRSPDGTLSRRRSLREGRAARRGVPARARRRSSSACAHASVPRVRVHLPSDADADEQPGAVPDVHASIWGSTWLAITYQLGVVRARGFGGVPVRARGRCCLALWCAGTRRVAALLAAQPCVPRRAWARRCSASTTSRVYWAERYVAVGACRRRVLDHRVHEPDRRCASRSARR